MKDVILFGIQGSGKGTQSALLLDAVPNHFSYFAMGDVFRTLTSTNNALGLYLKNRMAAGDLIKDEVTNSLFEAYVHTVLHDETYMLLDGYPRTISQVAATMSVLEEHKRDVLGIQFTLTDDIALERMRARGRADDTEEAMKNRINQFYTSTQPTIDYFTQHAELIKIDASRNIKDIHADVLAAVS